MTPPVTPASPPEEPAWSAGRWLVYLSIAVGLHLALFAALPESAPRAATAPARPPRIQSHLHLTPVSPEMDPTLFARPHPLGFAGQPWLQPPVVTFAPFQWQAPVRQLELPVEELGHWIGSLVTTNAGPPQEFLPLPSPRTVRLAPTDSPVRPRVSGVRLADGLEARRWRNAPTQLPLAPPRDNLTNTIAQVCLDARGFAVSALLLRAGSGDPELDQLALRLARTARFDPAPPATGPLVGTIIFEWATNPETP